MCHFACSSVHVSHGTSVRGPCKRYNFILKRLVFFTRFALISRRAHRETSDNIDTDLANPMDRESLWGTGHEVWQ